MATFKAVVLKHQVKSDKTVKVKIRITHGLESKYLDSGLTADLTDLIKVFKTDKTDWQYKIKTQSYIDKTDDIMREFRKKCNAVSETIQYKTIDQIIELISLEDKNTPLDFITFAMNHIEKVQNEGRTATARDYITAINCLKRFIKNDSLEVSSITTNFLKEFQLFIVANPINKKKVKETTMSRAPSHYLGSIRALHNAMKLQYNDEEKGIIRVKFSPFTKLEMTKIPVTKKRAINSELIKKVYDLPDEDIKNSTGSNRYNLAKDCFILSFCLMGINSADLFDCSNITKTQLIYNRKKTRTRRDDEALIQVTLQPEIKALLSKYKDLTGERVFNFYQNYTNDSNFNKALNKGLKTVGKKIGVPDLEFYSARHSFATIALNDAKVDKYTVHSALNHVDEAMKVTEVYLKKDWSLINDANRKVLDFVFKKKKITVTPLKKALKLQTDSTFYN